MKKIPIAVAVALSFLFLMSGCGGGSSSVDASPSGRDSHYELRKELMEVQGKLNAFALEHDLTESEAVNKAEEVFMEAMQAFQQARHEHPELAPLFEKSEELKRESVQKKIEGDEAASDELMSRFAEVRSELEQKAQALPELEEVRENLKQAERASVTAMADAAAAVNEEGEKIADQMKVLLQELD